MRTNGMILLGLGITLLIGLVPGVIVVFQMEGLGYGMACLACHGLVVVPLIVVGIVEIRKAEDSMARRDNESKPGVAHRTAWPIKESEPGELVEIGGGDPLKRAMRRVGSFDVNRLNWVGWILLLSTFLFVLLEAFVIAFAFDAVWQHRVLRTPLGIGLLFLAFGFFFGLRSLLGVFGVSIYRW